MDDKDQTKEAPELSVFDKLERAIARKLKIMPDKADLAAQRRAALRSLRLNKGELTKVLQTKADLTKLELHNQQLKDLEVIEDQYTNYFRNIAWKNNYHRTDEGMSGFQNLIEKSKFSHNTKELLKLKAKTPFRINLKDFENPEPNVAKYYEMIGLDQLKRGTIEPSHERSVERIHLSVDGKQPIIDDALKFGKFITQPSVTELQDYFNTNSESLLNVPKEKSMAVIDPGIEYSLPSKPKEIARHKLFQSIGVKDEHDKASTRYTNRTIINTKESDFFSTSKTTPNRNFLIKNNFKPLRLSSKKDIKSLKDKFEQLTSLCTEQSSQFSSHRFKLAQVVEGVEHPRGQSTARIRHSVMQNKESSVIHPARKSQRLMIKIPDEKNTSQFGTRFNLNRSSLSNSPTKKIKNDSLLTEDEENQENLKTISGYIDNLINPDDKEPSKRIKYFQTKQYKKLDTRDKIEQEVKRMFEANYKGPGGKTGALLASMLHHYISFGSPAASKMEVTQKVQEFLTKHKVKISMEELKKLAAEKHFYITSDQ